MYRNGFDAEGSQQWRCKNKGCRFCYREGQKTIVMDGKVVDVAHLPPPSSSPSTKKLKVGITLSEFRDKYDIEHIVRKTMAKLDKKIIYEKTDICKLAGLSPGTPGLGPVIESMSDFQGKAGGRVLYSHPETINMLKEEAKMI